MKVLRSLLVISALACVAAGRVYAAGTMMSASNVDGDVYCDIFNASTREITGQIMGVDAAGNVTEAAQDFTLASERGMYIYSTSGTTASCKVVLTSGKPKQVRGAAVYHYGLDGAYVLPMQ